MNSGVSLLCGAGNVATNVVNEGPIVSVLEITLNELENTNEILSRVLIQMGDDSTAKTRLTDDRRGAGCEQRTVENGIMQIREMAICAHNQAVAVREALVRNIGMTQLFNNVNNV